VLKGKGKTCLLQVFEKFDRNGNGTVGKRELRKSLKAMGVFLPKREVKRIARKYDEDGESGLDFDEFKNCLSDLGFL